MSASNPERCPFCTMPADRLIESNRHAFAVLDGFPVSPGHTLVVSRRHVADVFDLGESEIADMVGLIRSARLRLDRERSPTGYNVGVNVGADAGQTVMHVHIHVIPRYSGDTSDPTGGVRHVIPGKARYR
jgi:diadenosine tetraphosphate (Ap4A) HIT family hydrolase